MVTTLTPFGEFLQSHIDQAYRAVRRTFVINPRNWWERKTNEWITALFVRAIKLRPVQEEIAYQMGGNTPLCRVMKDAISSYTDAQDTPDIDVDDITGLETYIENALERFEIEASMVTGLEGFITDTVEDMEIDADKIRGLEADKIDGLDEMVSDVIAEKLNEVGDNVQDIEDARQNDLEAEVRNVLSAALEDTDTMDEIVKKVGQHLAEKLTS